MGKKRDVYFEDIGEIKILLQNTTFLKSKTAKLVNVSPQIVMRIKRKICNGTFP